MAAIYPRTIWERDRWIVERRGPRAPLDPRRPYAFFIEEERAESGETVPVVTVFLTNRECPWRCVFCDLWKNTLPDVVPAGAIPEQIDWALSALRSSRRAEAQTSDGGRDHATSGDQSLLTSAATAKQIKLYNNGSFFDPRAIPPADHPAIAERLRGFERVIVECHPAIVGAPALKFRHLLGTKLEVAMGLETAHPQVLAKLNKRMSLDQFKRAAESLREWDIAVRVFILVQPPFLAEAEALDWAKRSLDFAFACGATVASLIPVRGGNGALETLAAQGQFTPPKLATLEAAADYGVGLRRGRVFADLWDLEKFPACAACFPARRDRLRAMNLQQEVLPRVHCPRCEG
jgi:hypothetical protein